jgi:hypothetical protein
MHMYFQSLLGKKLQRQERINSEMVHMPQLPADSLDAPFTETEISAAISELPSEKVLGPDGFTELFYRSCWGYNQS